MGPTLIICIGGSGMKIGHAVKSKFNRYMPEALLSNGGKSGNVKFCFIENDMNEMIRAKNDYGDVYDEGNEIIRVGNINANIIVNEIKGKVAKNKKLTEIEEDINFWRDEKVHFADIITSSGLAANRQLGRVAIAEGYDTIYRKIEEFKKALENPNNPNPRGSITVYIISGTCGGTGSSMFFDVSAMIDQLMGADELPKKIAFLLNTKYFLEQKIESGKYTTESLEYKNLQINSWAFINECEFFMKKSFSDQSLMGKYTARKSRHANRVQEGRPYVPFTNAFLFDVNCSNGSALPLGNFNQTVADMIFYAMTSASMNKMDSEFYTNQFLDNEAKTAYVDYSTIAYKTIKFPAEEFRLYFEYRYMYEIFKDGFLKKEIDNKNIIQKANDFVDTVFKSNNTSVFLEPIENLKAKYADEKETMNSYTSLEQYLLPGNKLVSRQVFSELFTTHQELINSINKRIEDELPKIESFGFDKPYYRRGNVADILRRTLWEYAHDIILDHGYYGLLGITEGHITINGFINEVYELLKNYFTDITLFKSHFDESQLLENIENARLSVISKLEKGWGKKSLKDINNELNIYHEAIRNYFNQVEEYHLSRIKQNILYQFAIGDNKENLKGSFFGQTLKQTELQSYRHSISVGFGLARDSNDDTSCLIWAFRKEEEEKRSKTIRNNYLLFLPDEWDKTKNDLFTVHIPNDLSSFISTDSVDRWKNNTVISNLFDRYIKTGTEGLKSIFGDDINHLDYLLPRLGEEREKINEDIQRIKKRIKEKFEELYTNNSDSEIYKFLNRTIQEAYTNCEESTKEIIQSHVNNLIFPLRDVTQARTVIPGVNIHNSLETFVTETFNLDQNRVASYQNMPLNQMVLIGIATDFQYEKISENKIAKIVFEKRDINKFRPFLHNEWNNYVDGPYGALGEVFLDSDSGSSYDISEAFLICNFFDRLFAKVPQASHLVYINDDTRLALQGGMRATPISMDNRSKKFSFFTNSGTLSEKDKMKFYVKSETRNPQINLEKLYDSLEFSKAFATIRKETRFQNCFKDFLYIIETHKDAIAGLLSDSVKKEFFQEIVETHKKLERQLALKKRSKTINPDDIEFIERFSSKMTSLGCDLLNVSIE